MADDMNLVVTGNYNMAFKGDAVDGRAGGGVTETTTKEYAMNYEHTRTVSAILSKGFVFVLTQKD